ncbi:MAG: PhoPQ-activated protein PqaA family protein, partial [archaeon]|nr:PhoPQ-activated protein PqaA family protein [archaeon]
MVTTWIAAACGQTRTPLTEYVNAPDPTFAWEFVPNATYTVDGLTIYSVFLTSQHWLTPTDSNAYTWTHWIQVCVPDTLDRSADLSILWIDGGSTARISNPYTEFDSIAERFCRQSNLITSRLSAIPNQPVVFADDPSQRRRSEDGMFFFE